MKWHFGRTWWITVLTIFVEGILGILAINGVVKPEEVAVPAIAIAAAAVSHNAGRAWEDGKRNANPNTPCGGEPPVDREAPK